MSHPQGHTPRKDPSEAVRGVLAKTHETHASAPLRVPSEHGAFPAAITGEPLCAVLDTHWLAFDVNYACAYNQRTALVTAANQQLIRIFCAEHVADEIVEHVENWSVEHTRSVPVADFLGRWYAEYLPLLRVVPDDAIPDAWLTPDELARISALAAKDTDDIPSVKLALAIRGLYVSKDQDAVAAVYAADANRIDREKWLDHLKAGSDARELAQIIRGVHATAGVTGLGVFKASQAAYDALGWAGLLLTGGAAYLLWDWIRQPERRELRSTLGDIVVFVMEMELQREARQDVFDKVLPRVPSWSALSTTNTSENVRGRAAFYTLARQARADASARELTEALRARMSCNEAVVRSLLRTTPCFTEVYRGRWQIGAHQRERRPAAVA